MTFLIQFLTDVVFEADCHTPRGIDNWGQTWFKDYVVFVLEPFHCVEAFEILADHVLFFYGLLLASCIGVGWVTFS